MIERLKDLRKAGELLSGSRLSEGLAAMKSRRLSRRLHFSSKNGKSGRSGFSRISRRWRVRIGKHVGTRCVSSRNTPIISREWRWSVLTNGKKWCYASRWNRRSSGRDPLYRNFRDRYSLGLGQIEQEC